MSHDSHLAALEPQAAKAREDALLQEANPARMQLHDGSKRHQCRKNRVVDH
jgi:hypothetical protein